MRFSRLSKAARGYLLAEQGWIDPPLAPRNAEDVALDRAQIAEQAARDVLRECLDQVATNVVVIRELDDPEGPHQLRIGLRRLRSAFSVCASVLKSPEMTRLSMEARWLGQEVGRLRDIDMVANNIVRREAEATRMNRVCRPLPMFSRGRRGDCAITFARFSPTRACRRS
ncbi:CHAD domain-containing protein [Mesorhizobium sp.]|uniref:CHAD domain-containing protein n=1 Tax=Mesorhizobium sp. TaxID=1871066 RepID=UPI002579BAB4|nr:CHAD domain-containing protein [Mesorhizobium sp.]